MNPPTIRDVAARAGVSHQTVSRVINEHERVAAATRDRVLAAIKELGYVPNPSARSLSSNRLHTLGLVTTDISDYFFAQVAAGAEAEARRRGLFLIIGSVEEEADERAYLRLMLERRVEGVIVAWPTHLANDWLIPSVSERLPVVAVASDLDLPGVSVVDVDNHRGGFDATRYLIELGHRRIATVTGPLDWNSARDRLEGYRAAHRFERLEPESELVVSCSDWGLESGEAAAARLLDSGASFTALFAQTDLFALGAISELRRRGLRVPADVSVIGYDDIPVARFLDPPLTTMHQPMRDVGALAMRLVVDELGEDGRGADRKQARHLLRAPLVARESAAAPGY